MNDVSLEKKLINNFTIKRWNYYIREFLHKHAFIENYVIGIETNIKPCKQGKLVWTIS